MSKFAQYDKRIKQLEEEIRRLKPLSSTGTMMGRTTRGTSRRASKQDTTTTTDNAPRWA